MKKQPKIKKSKLKIGTNPVWALVGRPLSKDMTQKPNSKNQNPNTNCRGLGDSVDPHFEGYAQKKQTSKSNAAITLIALIITIIVMIILVAVTINIAINGGLFGIAKQAADDTETSRIAEEELATGMVQINDVWYNSMNDYVEGKPSSEKLPYNGYIGNGLVLYLDGIKNTKKGHNKNATVWEDLSGNNNDATLINYDNPTWDEKSLMFNGVNNYAEILNYKNLPMGDSPYTIEVVFYINEMSHNMGLFRISYAYGHANGVAVISSNHALRNYYWGSDLDTVGNEIEAGQIFNSTCLNPGGNRRIYLNSELKIQDSRNPSTIMEKVILGKASETALLDGNIYSVRVYDRALSDEEIKYNFEIDKNRFGF